MFQKLSNLKELLDIDYQLMATELDTSINDMECLSRDLMQDAITSDAFDSLVSEIETTKGVEITSFDDNTVLYEYMFEPIVIHSVLGNKYILFDSSFSRKIKNKLKSFM